MGLLMLRKKSKHRLVHETKTKSSEPSSDPLKAEASCNSVSGELFHRQRVAGWVLKALIFAGFPTLFAAFAVAFVRLEKGAIYLWDFATYWGQVLQLFNFLKQGGPLSEVLKAAYQSTFTSDYNLLPSLPLIPFQYLGFDQRTNFIVGVSFLYAGLLYWACVQMNAQFVESAAPRRPSVWPAVWPGIAGGLVMFASAALWHPVYRGFVDISALACSTGSVALLIKAEKAERQALLYTAAGVLMALAPVLRRAFSFLFVAYVGFLSIFWLVQAIRSHEQWASTWRLVKPRLLFFLGAASVFGLFHGFVVHSLKFNLGIAAAYKSNYTALEEWFLFLLGYIGLIPVVLSCLGVERLWRYKRLNATLTLLIIAPIFATMLMMRSQTLGEHHRYIFLAAFVTVLAAALGVAFQHRRDFGSKVFLILSCISCLGTMRDLHGAGSKGTFSLSAGNKPYAELGGRPVWWRILFGYAAPTPISRTDIAELQRLYSYLDRSCALDPNPRIYILASGIVLGDGVILSSLYPVPGLQFQSLNKLLPVHQVDLRDGLPNSLLQATHVITTDPIQLHLSPAQQKAVTVPWEEFRDGRGIAKAFERTAEVFQLENQVKAYVYRRTRPTTREDVSELEEDLRKSGLLK